MEEFRRSGRAKSMDVPNFHKERVVAVINMEESGGRAKSMAVSNNRKAGEGFVLNTEDRG